MRLDESISSMMELELEKLPNDSSQVSGIVARFSHFNSSEDETVTTSSSSYSYLMTYDSSNNDTTK